jgi:hypothetical protein
VEAGELPARMLGLAIRRIAIDHRRRRPTPERALVAQVDPKPPGLGLARTGGQNRHRRIVHVQLLGRHHMVGNGFHQRRSERGDLADPRRHDGPIELDAFACVDAGLPIERKMVAVFADQNMRQQPWPGLAAFDRQ